MQLGRWRCSWWRKGGGLDGAGQERVPEQGRLGRLREWNRDSRREGSVGGLLSARAASERWGVLRYAAYSLFCSSFSLIAI